MKDWLVRRKGSSKEYRIADVRSSCYLRATAEPLKVSPLLRLIQTIREGTATTQRRTASAMQSRPLKVSLPALAGNLLSRTPRKTGHWKRPCWSRSALSLFRVGSGGKLPAAGTADRHTLWGPDAAEAARPAGVCSPRPPEAGRTPFLLREAPAPSTDRA